MAKKTDKDAAGGAAAKAKGDGSPEAIAALLTSPCLQRGKEIPFHPVVHVGDKIEAVFGMCSSAGELFVFLDEISLTAQPRPPVAHQSITSSVPVSVTLSGLPAGRYIVLWKYAAIAKQWDVFAELVVTPKNSENGTVRFRRYQTSQDTVASSKVFLFLEVLP